METPVAVRNGARLRNTCAGILISAATVSVTGCNRGPAASSSRDSSASRAAPTNISAPSAIQGSFAYADSSGTRLLALDSLPEPAAVRGAMCSRGVALSVRYEGSQRRQPSDNGRQIASNFRNEHGDVFRILDHGASADDTCYLSSDTALLAGAVTVTMDQPSDCSPEEAARLAAAKGRRVIHCWRIVAAPMHHEIIAVQFATIDSSALASLAVVGDSILLFKDFPAVDHGSDGSTWRVDDGGVFSPADLRILFVAPMRYGYVMAFAWAGPEGESCELLLGDSATSFRTVAKGYRYWSPA